MVRARCYQKTYGIVSQGGILSDMRSVDAYQMAHELIIAFNVKRG